MGSKNRIKVEGSKLDRAVARICNGHTEGYDDGVKGFLKDLFYGGCASGIVGELVYYKDTSAFFARHKADIGALLFDALSESGLAGPADLFPGFNGSTEWDSQDPLALDDTNQNLLAWFAFEETARRLADREGWDL